MHGDLSADPAAWAELAAALAAFEESDAEHLSWGGGGSGPVVQMPYAIYSDAIERLLGALRSVGAVVPFDWQAWEGVRTLRGPTALGPAPVDDAVRMVTAIIRSERFSDGSIGGAIDDGTLLAAVRRLLRWHAEDR